MAVWRMLEQIEKFRVGHEDDGRNLKVDEAIMSVILMFMTVGMLFEGSVMCGVLLWCVV